MRQRFALSRALLAVLATGPALIGALTASQKPPYAVSHAGGQVTVITDADKNAVRVRSVRFR